MELKSSMPGTILHEYVHITLRSPTRLLEERSLPFNTGTFGGLGCAGAFSLGFLATSFVSPTLNPMFPDLAAEGKIGLETGVGIASLLAVFSPENHRCFVEA